MSDQPTLPPHDPDATLDRPPANPSAQPTLDLEVPAGATPSYHSLPPGDPAMPQCVGRFRVTAFLGEGTFGTVYRADDPQLDREVAIKVVKAFDDPAKHDRFRREAKTAAGLRHPNIVPLFEAGEADGRAYFASAFINGTTLHDALNERPMEARRAAELARKLADALAYAHAQGVIHRDVKSLNVMLDAAGEPHLLDFGLARRLEDSAVVTQDGTVLGTPAYLAPEVCRGEAARWSPAADQYALGVLVYELLTGRQPFEGPMAVVLTLHQVQEPPPPTTVNAAVPRDLEAVCLKCLEKNPARRYATCASLADDLRRWFDGAATVARPLRASERVARRIRRNPALAGLCATLLIVLVGAAVAAFAYQRQQLSQQLAHEAGERQARLVATVDALASADLDGVWLIHRFLEPMWAEAEPLLRAKHATATLGSRERIRYALALLPGDASRGDELLECLAGMESRDFAAVSAAFRELAPREGATTVASAPAEATLTVDLGGGATMEFVRVRAGAFLMGAPDSEPEATSDERPQHRVRILSDFYLGKYPVTQEQYRTVIGSNPSNFSDAGGRRGEAAGLDTRRFPVEGLSWEDATLFCFKLWWRDRRRTIRLPTEAEWEYACRGGTVTAFYWGDTFNGAQANGDARRPYGIAASGPALGPALGRPSQVGAYASKAPHPWGLCDMHGNVWQWCADAYGRKYDSTFVASDPHNDRGDARVLRGGSWEVAGSSCRAACRYWLAPSARNGSIGFRVLCRLD